MDGVAATIEFNCGETVSNIGSIPLALAAHKQHCNCEDEE